LERFNLKTDEAGRRTQEVKDCGIFAAIESAFMAARRQGLQAWRASSEQRCANPGPPTKTSRLDLEWGYDLRVDFLVVSRFWGRDRMRLEPAGTAAGAGQRYERRFGVETKRPAGGLSGSARWGAGAKGRVGDPALRFDHFRAAAMRWRADSTLARELNALMRTWPSPHLPKPAPGVQTTWALFSSRSKNSQESRPVLTQI